MRVPGGAEVLSMGECCQSQYCTFQFGIEIGGGVERGELVWYNIRRKEKLTWRQNADTVVRRATGTDARTAQTGFTNTVTTRSTANGAARQATGTDARMVLTGFTGMVRAATSASGAAQRPMARAVRTPRHAAMKSNDGGYLAEQRTEAARQMHRAFVVARDAPARKTHLCQQMPNAQMLARCCILA